MAPTRQIFGALALLAASAAAGGEGGSRLLAWREGQKKEKVAIIGSGNWGTAIAKVVGRNVLEKSGFDPEVRMYVYEEMVNGRKLSEIINKEHENVKYLKGVKLTDNVIADPDVSSAVKDATLLIFVMPHQFLGRLCPQIRGQHARGARACSLIKGIEFDANGPILISSLIKKQMGGMDVSVLMGANVAGEVAKDEFCESTVGYSKVAHGAVWRELFDCPTFRVNKIKDVAGVELCGALKNVVALGAGFCDGLGLGGNTKAAIIRVGLTETIQFCKMFYGGIKDETFLESCGVADLVTTCFGGRNRKCAEAFAKGGGKQGWEKIEAEMLNGQKLQGTLTAK
ncbi:glycerol-3-phosphate dehydrogenase 1-like protein, isoform CRA_d, partial [Pavlovales sp. CCMP2436]